MGAMPCVWRCLIIKDTSFLPFTQQRRIPVRLVKASTSDQDGFVGEGEEDSSIRR